MKARLKYTKSGKMKFIGHLDMVRYFQKAFRRAGLDMEYTKGFNPHQILSVAAPIGVGITSEGEYIDIHLVTSKEPSIMLKMINEVMAEGVYVKDFCLLSENSKNSMSIVAAADYKVTLKQELFSSSLLQIVDNFIKQKEIIILKKAKKSELNVDIRPMIYDIRVLSSNEIFMKLATGSASNLKPELVVKAMCMQLGDELPPFAVSIHRIEIYANEGDKDNPVFVPLDKLI